MKTLPALLCFVFGVLFLTMPRLYYVGDSHYWQVEAISLIKHGHLWIQDPDTVNTEFGQYEVRNPVDMHWYSKFGVMNSLLTVPPLLAERAIEGRLPVKRPPRRILYMNGYNVLLAVLLTAVLYRIASNYTGSDGMRAGFVTACLFATFLWNYLRAHSCEIYQVVLFSLLYWQLLEWKKEVEGNSGEPSKRARWTLAAIWVLTAALCLSRLVHVILLPAVGAYLFFTIRRRPNTLSLAVAAIAGPVAAVAGAILFVNNLKFGSPFSTGYEEWRPNITHLTQLNGNMTDGVIGLLADPQRSIFLCFPPMIGAALGFRRFVREHPLEGWFLAAVLGAYVLFIGVLPSWKGEWSYGPRYLAFLLPVASLPCLTFLEDWKNRPPSGSRTLIRLATVATVSVSVFLQVEVNRLWFFTYYRLHSLPSRYMSAAEDEYLRNNSFGWINYQLTEANGKFDQLPYLRLLNRKNLGEADMDLYRKYLALSAGESNYYWTVMNPSHYREELLPSAKAAE